MDTNFIPTMYLIKLSASVFMTRSAGLMTGEVCVAGVRKTTKSNTVTEEDNLSAQTNSNSISLSIHTLNHLCLSWRTLNCQGFSNYSSTLRTSLSGKSRLHELCYFPLQKALHNLLPFTYSFREKLNHSSAYQQPGAFFCSWPFRELLMVYAWVRLLGMDWRDALIELYISCHLAYGSSFR